jgi:GNAT superfamily N-acetyltransferase
VNDVRRATLADAPALVRLRRAWTEENAGEPVDDDSFEERFDAWLEREHDQRLTWVGCVDGMPVGMLNLLVFTRMPSPRPVGSTRPTQWGYLANFFVLRGHRGGGLGRALLDACTAYADDHGFARVVLSPSERSVSLYARHGFVPATSLLTRESG